MQARRAEMTKTVRARYTLEFKQEAVRLVQGGQSIAAAARSLGAVDQTLFNWVKAQRAGQLKGADSKVVSAEQMEISRLRAELARVKMERNILGKATAYFANAHKGSTPSSTATAGCGRSRCSAACYRPAWLATTSTLCAVPVLPSGAT
jgi:transposase